MYTSFDLDKVVMPVDPDALEKLLIQTEYDKEETSFLVNGFRVGFSVEYKGPTKIQQRSPNLKFTIGYPRELWTKVMKEVHLGRFTGPYQQIPFTNFIQSPIGLVPKGNWEDT